MPMAVKMNRGIEPGSKYRGRILVRAGVEEFEGIFYDLTTITLVD